MEQNKKTETYTYRFPSGEHAEVEVTPELAAILHREDRIEASNNQRNRLRAGKFLSLEQMVELGVQFTSRRDSIEHCYDVELLRRLMRELPENDLMLLHLLWEEGLTPTATARRLGVTPRAVKQRLERLYRRMAKRLDEMGAIRQNVDSGVLRI